MLQSFGYAWEGLSYAFATQRNMRIHVIVGGLAFLLGIIWGLDPGEMVLLSLTVVLVLAAEILNTALEVSIDLFTTEYNHLARTAKNLAAGAVLLTAINAVIVGYLLFGRPLLLGLWGLLQ